MDADDLAARFEDKASVRTGGKGGRKAGGAGAGKPGDVGKQREKQISMALSRLLRHQALNAGIKLDKEGYAPLDRVVSSDFSSCSSHSGLSFASPPPTLSFLCIWMTPDLMSVLLPGMLHVMTTDPPCAFVSIYLLVSLHS